MIIKRFAPTINSDYRLVDRIFENLATLAADSMNPFKRGEIFSLEFFASNKEAYFTLIFPDAHQDHLLEGFKYAYKGAGFADRERDPYPTLDDALYTLGVREHPFRPFKLKPEGEMWNRLLITLDGLKPAEEIRIQLLLEPLYDDWREDYRAAYRDYLETGSSIGGIGFKRLAAKGLRYIADAPKRALQQSSEETGGHKIKDTEAKLASSGMRTLVRLSIRSSPDRKTPLAHSVLAAFRTMNHENEWQLEDVLRRKAFIRDWEQQHLPRMDAPILCHDELRMFFQMPTEPSALLQRMTPEEKKTDERVTKKGIQVGHTYSFGKLGDPIYFVTDPHDDLNRSRIYIAPPGGGKTTQIMILWTQIASLGFGGALWDVADGNLYRKAMEVIDEKNAKRIIAIDYTNDKNPPIFNFSALAGSGDDASQMFAELFDVLFSGSDLVRSRNFMLKAAMTTFAFPEHQFLEFILLMRDSDFRKQLIPRLRTKNPDLYLWWVRDFPRITDKELDRMIAPILDRCEQLFDNKNLKCMMNGRYGHQSPRKWMDEAKLVHYNVSGGRFSENEQRIIMAMHNQAYWAAILSREELTIRDCVGNPFFLIYDEPQTYINATPMFERAISKARKYGASCNFFIQDAEQIIKDNPALWRQLLGMKPHIMLGHVGEETAKHLVREYRPLKLEELLEVEKYEYSWWLKTYANKKAVDPILVRSLDSDTFLKRRDPSREIINSVMTYAGRSGEKVREDISARNMRMSVDEYRTVLSSYENTEQEGVEWVESEEAEASERK